MVQKRPDNERTGSSSLYDPVTVGFAATAKKFADAQAELFENCQETSKQWLDRIEAEANLNIRICIEASSSTPNP